MSEQFGYNTGYLDFLWRFGFDEVIFFKFYFGQWQCAAVNFSVGGHGHLVEAHHSGRYHEFGEVFRHEAAELIGTYFHAVLDSIIAYELVVSAD